MQRCTAIVPYYWHLSVLRSLVPEGPANPAADNVSPQVSCFVLFRFVALRFVSFRFVAFRCVSFRFVSFPFVSFRFFSFRFLSVRFGQPHFSLQEDGTVPVRGPSSNLVPKRGRESVGARLHSRWRRYIHCVFTGPQFSAKRRGHTHLPYRATTGRGPSARRLTGYLPGVGPHPQQRGRRALHV